MPSPLCPSLGKLASPKSTPKTFTLASFIKTVGDGAALSRGFCDCTQAVVLCVPNLDLVLHMNAGGEIRGTRHAWGRQRCVCVATLQAAASLTVAVLPSFVAADNLYKWPHLAFTTWT